MMATCKTIHLRIEALRSIVCILVLAVCQGLFGQAASGSATVSNSEPASATDGLIHITQRYDLRRSVNGKPIGVFYGYSLGTWHVVSGAVGSGPSADGVGSGARTIQAQYYLSDESIQDLAVTEKLLEGEFSSVFTLEPDGSAVDTKSGQVPYQRGFPRPPPAGTKVGGKWIAPLQIVLPANAFSSIRTGTRPATTFNLLAEYTLAGNATWLGQTVVAVSAKYALRYRAGQDPSGDPDLSNVEGTRDATIYLDPQTYSPVYVREQVGNETYSYTDGMVIRNNGFIVTFYQGSIPLDRKTDATLIADTLSSPTSPGTSSSPSPLPDLGKGSIELPDINIANDPRGIAITLENLHFQADTAVLLAGDDRKLDQIAAVLKSYPDRSILVVGHTARVGSVETQDSLSVDRAKAIVAALKTRGIEARRLLFEGHGAREPIGDNDTEAGRAQNRRVQVIILD